MEYEKPLTFHETGIPGLILIDLAVHGDSRGWFKENWQREKMLKLGLPDFCPVQNNVSYNVDRGVTRGIHAEPWDKFISIGDGSIFGVWVDLRPGETYGKMFTCTLDPSKAIFVPRGVGNAYQALEDNTVYTYLVNAHWSAERKSEYTFVNLTDPTLAIKWPIPLEESIRSEADLHHPFLQDATPMEPLHVLVTGANGQLGRALQQLAKERGFSNWDFFDASHLDITNPAALETIDWDGYSTIINAAAYTAVDKAETPEGRLAAWKVNVCGVANLARIATEHRLALVHISSDYVFDGRQVLHTEDEPFSPLGVYGQTKAAADAIVATVPRHFICRTSWVVGDGKNFVRTMAQLAERCKSPEDEPSHLDHVTVVNDQIGRLTFADELARVIVHLLGMGEEPVAGATYDPLRNCVHAPWGTYNVTCDGKEMSWADIARAIFAHLGASEEDVVGVASEKYFHWGTYGYDNYGNKTAPASPRPQHSTLALAKLEATGFKPKDALQALADYLGKDQFANV